MPAGRAGSSSEGSRVSLHMQFVQSMHVGGMACVSLLSA